MTCELGGRAVRVARPDRLEEPFVMLRSVLERGPAQRPGDLLPQAQDLGHEARTPRDRVEPAVEAFASRELVVGRRRRDHLRVHLLEDLKVLVGDERHREPDGVALEQDAELVDLFDVVGVELGDGETAPRHRADESLVLERAERLPHRDAAGAEERRQLLLPQSRPRRKRCREDRLAHRAQHEILRGQVVRGVRRDDPVELGLPALSARRTDRRHLLAHAPALLHRAAALHLIRGTSAATARLYART